MQCVFRTNPVQRVQDDYLWYRLSGSEWVLGPRTGNASPFPEAEALSRGFSSIRQGSSFLVLLKETDRLRLVVGVLSERREVGQFHRPITDTLYLRAENETDDAVLCGFAAACFAAEDADGLGNPASAISSAIDAIWKTASLDAFMAAFRDRSFVYDGNLPSDGSWRYARTDGKNRRAVAAGVRQLAASSRPFLAVLTDRSPDEALLQAIPDFKGNYNVFSSRVEHAEKVVRSDFPIALPRNRLTRMKIAVRIAAAEAMGIAADGRMKIAEWIAAAEEMWIAADGRMKIAVGIAAAGVVGLLALVGSCEKTKPEFADKLSEPLGMPSQRSQNPTTSAKPYANLPTGVQSSCETNSPNSLNQMKDAKGSLSSGKTLP